MFNIFLIHICMHLGFTLYRSIRIRIRMTNERYMLKEKHKASDMRTDDFAIRCSKKECMHVCFSMLCDQMIKYDSSQTKDSFKINYAI